MTRIHFLLPSEGSTYGTACAPALVVAGGRRAAVVSKQLTPHLKLVSCRLCRLVVETARAERQETK